MGIYWNNDSPRQEEANRQFKKLVPLQGKCDTLEGELVRASSKIYYDYYNNGFGNNWSGAYIFLKHYFWDKHPNMPDITILEDFYRGKCIDEYPNEQVEELLETIVNMVTDHVSENDHQLHPNPRDMLELQLPEFPWDEEEE